MGINFFNTACIWGQATGESLLIKVFEPLRDRMIITRKVGGCLSAEMKAGLERFEQLAVATGMSQPAAARQFLLQLDRLSSALLGTIHPEHLQKHLFALSRALLSPEFVARFCSMMSAPFPKST